MEVRRFAGASCSSMAADEAGGLQSWVHEAMRQCPVGVCPSTPRTWMLKTYQYRNTYIATATGLLLLMGSRESNSKSGELHTEDLHGRSSPILEIRKMEEHYKDVGVHAAHLSVLHCKCYGAPGVVTRMTILEQTTEELHIS